jgi:hypothetical protein
VELPPAIVGAVTHDMSMIGTRLGMSFVACGMGLLCGPPVVGAILSATNQYYLDLQLYSGFCTLGSAAMFMHVKQSISGGKSFSLREKI